MRTDTSKQQRATKDPPRFEAQILDGVGHAIVAGDFDGNLIYWNKAAEALYGWRREEVLGRNAREVGAPSFSQAEADEIIGLLREGKTWSGELPLQRRDGSRFVGAVISAPLRDGNGEPAGIATSITDITAPKEAEIASRQLEVSLAQAQKIARLGSWEWDVRTGEARWSDQLYEIAGVPKQSAPGYDTYIERVHPDDRERVEEAIRLALVDKPDLEHYCRLRLPNGTIKLVHTRAVVSRDEEGRALRLAGTIYDITGRWSAEEALRLSEERFRSLVQVTAAIFWWTDAAGQIAQATPSWTEFTGMSAEAMAQPDGWFAAVHPDDRARAMKAWRGAAGRGSDYSNEYRLRRHDGVWRHMIARGAPIPNSDGTIREWIGTCVDVTELKTAEEAVRFQAQVLETTRESIIATDPAGIIIYMNGFAATQFRVDPKEAIGADILAVTVPSTSRQQAEEIMQTLRRGETWSGEFDARRRDGSKFPIHARNTPLYNEAGELIAIVGVARDMTEYQESRRALRESEERYRATFDQAAVGVCQIAFDGTFERVNPRLSELLGYSSDELMRLKFSDITHPDDLPRSMALVAELSGQERKFFAIEQRYMHKDGHAIWARLTVSLMRFAEGKPRSLIAIVEDISAQKEAELALRQREAELRALTVRLNTAREEEAKRIARELHDELGQALTAINLEAADAQRQLAEAEGSTPTEGIQRRLASMRALLEQAIGTTRRVCTELRPALLDQVGLIPALEWQAHDFEARTGIFCNLMLPEPAPEITGEVATALFRILQEMLTNAARHSAATEVTVDLATGPEEIRLTVHDNGQGTPDAQAKRRSGLGLIGIRERTLAIGGTVNFERANGTGTRVSIVVPQPIVRAENG